MTAHVLDDSIRTLRLIIHPDTMLRRIAPRIAPPRNETVVLGNDFVFDTLIVNDGRPNRIVFLHGLGGSPELMMLLLEHLAITHDATILAPHLPCHGHTSDVASYPEFIDRIAEWFDRFELSGVPVIGHSLGALTLVHLASIRPDLVSGGVCLALPTKRPATQIKYQALMATLAADVSFTTSVALTAAILRRRGRLLSSALIKNTLQGCRLQALSKLLQDIADPEINLCDLAMPMQYLFGGADIAIRPPRPELGIHPVVLAGQPHCFPLLRTAWPAISVALERVLYPESSPELTRLIPKQHATNPAMA